MIRSQPGTSRKCQRTAILPYGARAASWHASERARLVAAGKAPALVDGQIAAGAFVRDLTLVTANTADYANFAELRIENWTSG